MIGTLLNIVITKVVKIGRWTTSRVVPLVLVTASSLWIAIHFQRASKVQVANTSLSLKIGLSLRHGGIVSLHATVNKGLLAGTTQVPSTSAVIVRLHSLFAGPLVANLALAPNWSSRAKSANFAGIDGNRILRDLKPALMHQVYQEIAVVVALGCLVSVAVGFLQSRIYRERIHIRRYIANAICCSLASLLVIGGVVKYAESSIRPVTLRSAHLSGNLQTAGAVIDSMMVANTKISVPSPLWMPDQKLGQVRVLHVSDDHLNYEGFVIASQWARAYGAQIILDTGDTTDNGTTTEVDYLVSQGIALFNLPYVYVRGNHDSLAVQSAISRLPNVHALDGQQIVINGLRFYGRGDPLFSPGWQISGPTYERPGLHTIPGVTMSDAEQACIASLAVPFITRDLQSMPTPDIVAVHDSEEVTGAKRGPDCVTRGYVVGSVPLIVAGHWHKQSNATTGLTMIMHTGTIGADGLTAVLDPASSTPYSADLLTFSQVGAHMELTQEDVLSVAHRGNQITGQTIDDRLIISEPWYQTLPSKPLVAAP